MVKHTEEKSLERKETDSQLHQEVKFEVSALLTSKYSGKWDYRDFFLSKYKKSVDKELWIVWNQKLRCVSKRTDRGQRR